MDKNHATPGREKSRRQPLATIVPIFVCPGVRIVPSAHLVFPHGADCSEIAPCPIRECCVWHCRHDLGETHSLADFPAAAVLDVRYRARPFFCSNYRDDERESRGSGSG